MLTIAELRSVTPVNEERAQQGARANDHGCHDPCSEQHGSRQPRSWLILNVGQNMSSADYASSIKGFRLFQQSGDRSDYQPTDGYSHESALQLLSDLPEGCQIC